MRARSIKPSIFKNEILARLAPGSFRAFTGLWCLADRKGRLEDRPDRIEAELFPFKFQKVNIEKTLNDLASGPEPFIIRYEADKKRYIQIVNFEKHQYPHHREKESLIPALGQPGAFPIPAHLTPDSPFLNPDPPISPKGGLVGFETFWKEYPKKVGKGDAIKAWAKIKPLNGLVEEIIQAVISQKRSGDWTKDGGKYIPHPSTWLNGQRWLDEIGLEKKEAESWDKRDQVIQGQAKLKPE